jgi:hypothetical protein
MDALTTFELIRELRNARDVYRNDPVLNEHDRAYRAGMLNSTREWPGWEGTPRPGRCLPPSRNLWEASE